MTLVDHEIASLSSTAALIAPFEATSLQNCRYYLRAGRAFLPNTGEEAVIGAEVGGTRRLKWRVGPAETLIIRTIEAVTMPGELYASYGQLNHLARKGLMLINSSIVEPGYHGHLSCFLVNFSKQTIQIAPGDPVAKICFHRLTKGGPAKLVPESIEQEKYDCDLSSIAAVYPRSLVDVAGLEERVLEKSAAHIRKTVWWGGALIIFLLLWASLEPVLSRWLWEKGVTSGTSRAEMIQLRDEILDAKRSFDIEGIKNDIERQREAIERVEKALQRGSPTSKDAPSGKVP